MQISKKHLYYGLLLTASSFLYWLIPPTVPHIVGTANAAFYLGNILLFDYLSEQFSGFSLLKRPNKIKDFLIVGLIFAICIEFYMNWVGKFWYYPRWSVETYWLVLIPGFAYYVFYLFETFLGIKAILEYFLLNRKFRVNFKGLKFIFISLGIIGTALFSSATTFLLVSLKQDDWQNAFNINQPRVGNPDNWYLYFIVCIGLWLLLEFYEYQKRETSIIYQLTRGNPWPLAAVFIAGFFSAILYEVFNIPGGLWRYVDASVPFANLKFLNFPIFMYIGWPFQYLPALALYRILFKEDSGKILD